MRESDPIGPSEVDGEPISTMDQEEYEQVIAEFVGPTCDDCGRLYDSPAYYTIGLEVMDKDEIEGYDPNHVCTGNLCPDCAGPDLDPDDPNDPRKPV